MPFVVSGGGTTSGGGGGPAVIAQGTTLPTAATGLEYYWEVDATNHVVWHMRYNGTVWVFLGGPPLVVETATSETTTSSTYANLSGGATGPAVTTPGAGGGLYIVEIGAATAENTASITTRMSYDIGATGAVDGDSLLYYSGSSTNAPIPASARKMLKTFAAAVTLTCKYKASGGTGTWQLRWISILPVTVNAS